MPTGLPFVRSDQGRKVAAAALLTFFILFGVRFVAALCFKSELSVSTDPSGDSALKSRLADIPYEKAVSNNVKNPAVAQQGVVTAGGQLEVFADEAWLCLTTTKFEMDEVAARRLIKNQGGVVRIEQLRGRKPQHDRVLQLVVRVSEDKFADLVKALQAEFVKEPPLLDKTLSVEISREDRSAEMRTLLVDRKSLEGYPTELATLRDKNTTTGKVSELIDLENKLQSGRRKLADLEARIQGFTGSESYSNLRFDLGEQASRDQEKYSIGERCADALRWAARYYFPALAVVTAFGLIAWSGRTLFTKTERNLTSDRR